MRGRPEESSTLVLQTPNPTVCARFEDFVRKHSDAVLHALKDVASSALCISLACSRTRSNVATWVCVFRHDGKDITRIEDSINGYLQSPCVLSTLEPLDLTTETFQYRISSGLYTGEPVPTTGRVFFRRPDGGQGKSASPMTALYTSKLLTNTATIGCLAKTRNKDGNWSLFGVTLATVSDDLSERGDYHPDVPPTSTTERGEGEMHVLSTDTPAPKAEGILLGGSYEEGGPAAAHNLSLDIVDNMESDTRSSVPWCLVLFDDAVLLPAPITSVIGHKVTAAVREPRVGAELIILGNSATGQEPRCKVLNPYAWIKFPGSTLLFPVRKLQALPNYGLYYVYLARFRHPSLIVVPDLAPMDIGSLVVEETDGAFEAHYQVLAIGNSDEAYVVSLNDLLGLLKRSGCTDTTILSPSDVALAGNGAVSAPPSVDATQLILRSAANLRTDAIALRNSEIPLESFEAVLSNPSPRSVAMSSKAVKAFKKAVQRYTINNYLKQDFVLIERLDQWMQGKATDPSRPSNTWVVLLLVDSHEYHRGIDNYPALTTIRDDIRLSSDRSIFRLFCILLQIDAGHLIEPLSYFLCDDDLPLSSQNLESELLSRDIVSTPGNAHDLAQNFVRWQYSFCCRPLLRRKVTKFNAYEIIPITRMEPVNDREQIANVYHIEIPLDCVSSGVQELVGDEHRLEIDGIVYYEFAVKSFNDARHFRDELSNFVLAQDIPSVVQWLSQYEVHNSPFTHDRSSCQYNLVLELGRLDLNQLILSTKSPVLFRDVLEVWSSLGTVIEALCGLHSRVAATETEGIMIQGWHADIKPENILRAGNTWKLADLGHSRFKLNLGKMLSKADYVGGTVTYGAPETFSRSTSKSNVTPRIDIWSLGAVFSAVATWVILGAPGVAHYKRVRQTAIHSLLTQESNRDALYTGDYFHNGREVLPEVTAWHDFLRYSLRNSDPLTGKILDMVDQFMLKGDPRCRYGAADIDREYKRCLGEARSADFEPRGVLWSQHRNIIALAEQEASDEEFVMSHFTNNLTTSRRALQSAPSSPEQHPRNPLLSVPPPESLTLSPSSKGLEKVSTSTEEGVMEPVAPRPSSVVRFKNPQGDSPDQRFDMSWARKSLRLDEKRFRSPTRSLLRSAAKKVGMKKKKSERGGDAHLASFYRQRHLVGSSSCFLFLLPH
ncbi:hypothetical protein B0T14DRAFT_251520 [Immersiella caudata]|uniref:Protein kinase domain-containing protein n=1 Tax=Immersiella caudata TaxID=314043 RepID=A0AA39WJU0_9PEZI|nr:hypothetical protein B0T14DRAFT_251520 [Immersiella caudata]